MSGLVEDLLDLARVDAGRAPLTPVPVPIGALLEDAVAEAKVLGRQVEYDVRVDPDDLEVQADPARLRQLVANLLDNASRHSPTGGTVLVAAEPAGERYRLEVHDEGPGIAGHRPGAGLRAVRHAARGASPTAAPRAAPDWAWPSPAG